MESIELFKPKFTGQRFDDHTLPLELLDDIASYEGLLFQVAKDIFYKENHARRVPNGFGNGIYLKLSKIEDGSAIPTILLAASTWFAGNIDTKHYFEKAQNQIVETIAASESDQDISNMLSPDALSYFNRIGKNLREDEVIDFAPSTAKGARLTQVSRRKIVLASPTATTVESDIHLRGNISALDKDPLQFTFQGLDKTKIIVPVSKEHFKHVQEAFNNFEHDKRVLITGIGVYNKQNKLESIQEIKNIIILDKRDVPTQLENFRKFENGWMNGEGVSYSKDDLTWLGNQFDYYFSPELLLPFTFPTVEGGVQFEWKRRYDDATLEVDLSDKSAYLHYYNFETHEETEETFNLTVQEDWVALNKILLKYFKASASE